jgi:SAM-dependent methyltransferase
MANEPDARFGGRLVDSRAFDACYYARSCGRPYERSDEWLAFFGGIADRIAADIRPRRVLDAGCALGLLVETLRARDIDAFGIDVSAFAIEHVYEPVKKFCRQGSVTEPLGEQYDLIVCIEVLEHMSAAEAEMAIANFCAHSHDILFSSSPFDFREETHTNVQPPEYWAGHFARHGFYRDLDFDASFITAWAVRFRRRTDPPHRLVADYERAFSQVVIERNELRAQALATQAEISRITRVHDEAQQRDRPSIQRLHEAEANLADAHAQLADAHAQLADAHAHLADAGAQLAHARTTIDSMERSWFWRARRPWAWISGKMGRPT